MTKLIEKINPSGIDKPNRGGLFRTMGRIGDIVNNDITLVSRSFFPLLSDDKKLMEHGESLGIYQFPGESKKEYRNRVATGSRFVSDQGLRSQVVRVLDKYIPDRYIYLEAPKMGFRLGYSRLGESMIIDGHRLIIKVRNLSELEKDNLYSIFDKVLDPDIEVIILPFKSYSKTNVTLDELRLFGGSKWLENQLFNIQNTRCFLLPEDGFKLGSTALGSSCLYGIDNPLILVLLDSKDKNKELEISNRLTELVSEIEWRIIYE